jgi:hypothetical protein
VWIDHLRHGDSFLVNLLNTGRVLAHPFVIGELALGNLQQREVILDALSYLSCANIAADAEVLTFINQSRLYGVGIGYIDAHLLASVRLTPGTLLWTRDKRLRVAAVQHGLLANLDH